MTRGERTAWGTAAAGLLGAAVGAAFAPAQLPHAWLSAAVVFSLWPLGSLGLLLIHAMTGGGWGDALRPGLLAGVAALPLAALLLLPVAFALPQLYPWARPDGPALPNAFWLNVPFFAVRGVVYIAAWLGIGALVLRGGDLSRIAAPGLLVLAVTTTFASIDLTMSLDPHFISSSYGMIAMAAAVLLGLACAVLASGDAGPPANPAASPPASPAVNGDIGKLMLAMAGLWTYLDFMQVVIVWQSDLVTQVPWYAARAGGGWGWTMAAVALLHGIVPIAALMLRPVRESRGGLVAVAVLLIATEALRAWWTVLPAAGRGPGLLDLCCMLAAGALGVGVALRWTAGSGALRHA